MFKRLLKNSNYIKFLDNYPRFKLGALLVAVLCAFLLVISTFTQIPLGIFTVLTQSFIHPVNFFSNIDKISNVIIKPPYYIPQVPVVVFTGALLGPRIGIVAIGLYVLAGLLGYPVFASGGGIGYYTQLGFGYILGYFLGIYLVGNVLSGKITSLTIIRAAIVGVFTIHLTGIIYLTMLMFVKNSSILLIFDGIWALSGRQLAYDLLFSFMVICLARPVRSLLWIAMD